MVYQQAAFRNTESSVYRMWTAVMIPRENMELSVCPIDGSQLFMAPDGKMPYCNAVHQSDEIEHYSERLAEERQ